MRVIKKEVENLLQLGLSKVEAARRLGCTPGTVLRNCPPEFIRKGNYTRNPRISLTAEERQIIEGEILGDGRLTPPPVESYFVHGGKEREYTSHLRERLKRLCENPTGRYQGKTRVGTSRSSSSYGTHNYYFNTKANPALTELWGKWYIPAPREVQKRDAKRKYQKHIPDDLMLTPTVLKYWYLGDGSIVRRSPNSQISQVITISSYDLPRSQLEHVIQPQLSKFRIKTKIYADLRKVKGEYGYVLVIPDRYVPRFLQLIGDCPVRCYRYKWAYQPHKGKRFLPDEDEILTQYWGKINYSYILEVLGCKYHQARKRVERLRKRFDIPEYHKSGRPIENKSILKNFKEDPLVKYVTGQEG